MSSYAIRSWFRSLGSVDQMKRLSKAIFHLIWRLMGLGFSDVRPNGKSKGGKQKTVASIRGPNSAQGNFTRRFNWADLDMLRLLIDTFIDV